MLKGSNLCPGPSAVSLPSVGHCGGDGIPSGTVSPSLQPFFMWYSIPHCAEGVHLVLSFLKMNSLACRYGFRIKGGMVKLSLHCHLLWLHSPILINLCGTRLCSRKLNLFACSVIPEHILFAEHCARVLKYRGKKRHSHFHSATYSPVITI